MSKETIAVGTEPNDGTGDQVRVAFEKINSNTDEMYATGLPDSNLYIETNTIRCSNVDGNITIAPDGNGIISLESDIKIASNPPLDAFGEAGDLAGMITYDTDYIYMCIADYVDGVPKIWKRVVLTEWV